MSHRLQVLIPESLDRQLEAAAQRSRMSKGAWVRQAVEAALQDQRRPAPGDPLAALAALAAPTGDVASQVLAATQGVSVRDAIHAGVMLNHGIQRIATFVGGFDGGFDGIAGVLPEPLG